MLLAVLAFATACTQDELTDTPSATSQMLEIASATIARAEGDEATTTNAGTGTVDGNWVKDDEITVMFMGNNATAIYKYSNGSFTSDNPINCNGKRHLPKPGLIMVLLKQNLMMVHLLSGKLKQTKVG